jgi:aminoglycoside phosphotransferase (APT) family kinase protein
MQAHGDKQTTTAEGTGMTLIDQATDIRTGEELDAQRIDAYLKAHVSGLSGTPHISQFPGGASNLTYLIRYPERELVLRRPPFGQKARSAHDMGREFRILNGLKDAFPYCPRALVLCADETLIGSPFYVMERLKGIILRADLPPELGLSSADSETLCKGFIDKLVDLHQVDYQACGLGDLGRPDGYVQRQISGWRERYEKAMTPDAPHWDKVKQWLADRMPADHPNACIVHNDYRFDNIVLDPDAPLRITGVLDWELATLGDPLMDLGNTLAYWIEADDPAPVKLMRRQPSHIPGMLTRREFVAYYAQRAGIRIDNFDYYYAYGLFRLAGIVQQIYYRFYHGQTQDKRFASFVQMNRLLEHMTLHVIEQSDF